MGAATGIIEVSGRPFAPYISEEQVRERTDQLAQQIIEDYEGKPLHVISIALGGMFWTTDLTRAIRRLDRTARITLDSVSLTSYPNGSTVSSGILRNYGSLKHPVAGKNVILVDEVVDSGLTLSQFSSRIGYGEHDPNDYDGKRLSPASVAIAALTDKATVHNGKVIVHYPGFEVPDVFLVGCGMDYNEEGRELTAVYQSATPDDVLVTEFLIPDTKHPDGLPI